MSGIVVALSKPMHRHFLLTAALCTIAVVIDSHAQSSDDNVAQCRENNPNTVIAACSAVINGNSEVSADLLVAYRNRAAVESRRGDRRAAIADYSAAINLEPKIPALYVSRGLAERASGDLDAAIRDYSRAIELDPAAASPYVSRGFAEADQGALDAAIEDYDRALARDDGYAFAYADRGVARAGKGDLDRALKDLTKAIEINPKYAFAYTNRGNIKRADGDITGAAFEYAEAIRVDRTFALAYFNRGVLEFNARDFDLALMDVRKAIELDPSTDIANQARLYLWIIRARRGEREEASRELSDLLAHRPTQYVDGWTAKRMEFLVGTVNEEALLKAARTPPTLLPSALARRSAQADFLTGVMRMLSGDALNARRLLAECMALDHTPDSPYASAKAEAMAIAP